MSGEEFVQKKISFVCGVTTEGEVLQERERPYDSTGMKCAIWTLHRPKGHHSQHEYNIIPTSI